MYDISFLQLGNHGSNLTEEQLETHTIAAWKDGKAMLNNQVDVNGRPLTKELIFVSFLGDIPYLFFFFSSPESGSD